MKTLLILKRIDFWSQILAIIFALCIMAKINSNDNYMLIHISLGTTQLLSVLFNGLAGSIIYKHSFRKIYNRALAGVVIICLGTFTTAYINNGFANVFFYFLWAMLLAGPVMGILYLVISYREMRFIRQMVQRHELIK